MVWVESVSVPGSDLDQKVNQPGKVLNYRKIDCPVNISSLLKMKKYYDILIFCEFQCTLGICLGNCCKFDKLSSNKIDTKYFLGIVVLR